MEQFDLDFAFTVNVRNVRMDLFPWECAMDIRSLVPTTYRLSHIKFHSVIGRRRITIQPPPSGLVKFNI